MVELEGVTDQGALLLAVLLVCCTGAMVGTTKLLQVLATADGARFATESEAVAQQFLVAFGASKAVGNLLAGYVADRWGRKCCMLAGWSAGALFAALILLAKSWTFIVVSDLLLGLNQALCWSAALFIAHDVLARYRGIASGLIETGGYVAIAAVSPVVGAVGFAQFQAAHVALLVTSLACATVSAIALRETAPRREGAAAHDASMASRGTQQPKGGGCYREIATYAHNCCLDAGLAACSVVGLCLNLSTAYAWGAMSRWLTHISSAAANGAGEEEDTGSVGSVSAGTVLLLYSLPKGVLQLPAGLLSDAQRCGLDAKKMVLLGLAANVLALVSFAALIASSASARTGIGLAAPLAFLLGASTACAYSPAIACAAARADPTRRASALGVYRFWRDLGYAFGALLLGGAADAADSLPWIAPLLAAAALSLAALLFAAAFHSHAPPIGHTLEGGHSDGREATNSTRGRGGRIKRPNGREGGFVEMHT
jgi:MFS family permease